MTQQLPRPSLPGDTLRAAAGGSHILLDGNPPGVVSIDPWTVQCARCGAVDECPPPRKWTTFLLTCGYEFHICTSGSEGRLCRLEGFQCIAIEREADYLPLIRQRIDRRRDPVAATRTEHADDLGLFGLLDGETA